jgi:CRISPR-associated protein Csd2
MQITKSVNGESGKDSKASDTMGTKHRVDFAVYVFHGSINCQLAEKTGFTEEDAEKIKDALETLFENDCSSARPEGTMDVRRVYWYKHDNKTPKISSAKVHRLLSVKLKDAIDRPRCFDDYEITVGSIDGLVPEVFEG